MHLVSDLILVFALGYYFVKYQLVKRELEHYEWCVKNLHDSRW